ncbi:MAG: aconitase X [Bacilli bacterium]
MYEAKMKLTAEQKNIMDGKEGETKAKMMECLVRYGDIFNADSLLPLTHKEGHLVTSFGIKMLTPIYPMMDQLIKAGLKAEEGFTADPRPMDFENVKASPLEKLVFKKFMYSEQEKYEEQLKKVGLIDKDAFSCTCYLKEVGNTPKMGDVLSWAESSAVVFANSVLGARCNRNSGVIELFGTVLGYAPRFGFLTDEGRKAKWKVVIQTSKLPEAQILGSAIGMKALQDVPYVIGLDKWLKDLPDDDTLSYLKDFGAATASNGAVGLYHIDKITPEAKEKGQKLIEDDAKEYIIDDAEIERVYKSYPIMWKNPNKKAYQCFIGCPHLTLKQLNDWTLNIEKSLKESGKKKLVVRTVLTTSPQVAEVFKKTENYQKLIATGAHLSSICPLMYADNPLCGARRLMTNSNKLRTYTFSRYYKDADVLKLITGKEKF